MKPALILWNFFYIKQENYSKLLLTVLRFTNRFMAGSLYYHSLLPIPVTVLLLCYLFKILLLFDAMAVKLMHALIPSLHHEISIVQNSDFHIYICRCICGGMDLSTEKDQSLWGEHSQQRCLGCRVTAVRQGAGTTSITLDLSRWKISERFRRITRGSMGSSLSCVGNAVKPLQWEAIGGLTRRIVGSSGMPQSQILIIL